MNLLPYSNGFHGEKTKRKINPFNLAKIIILILFFTLILGFLYEFISSKIEESKIPNENKFLRIEGQKYHYKTIGKGHLTVIFDGDLGMPFNQWEKVAKNLEKQQDLRLLFYNRQGYGFNDYDSKKTPRDQAKDLRKILKKLGMNGPVILVGEGYGSLVLSNFADLYSKYVEGMVLINPINEKEFSNSEFTKLYSGQKIKRKVSQIGSYFSLSKLMYKLKILKDPTGYLDNIDSEKQKEFKIFRTSPEYTSAYYNEIYNIMLGNSNCQRNGLIGDKYLSVIINRNGFAKYQKDLVKLATNKEKIDLATIKNSKDVLSLENANDISTSIRQMVKKYKHDQKVDENN